MTLISQNIWNLAQAAAWVVYRENELVGLLNSTEPGAFGAIGMYRTMWPKGRKTVGKLQELHDALTSGRLPARGYRNHKNSQHVLIDIPKREWADLHLAPPYAYDAAQLIQKIEPWRSIQVDSADMKRLWRSELEVKGRSVFDHDLIRDLFRKAEVANPDMSRNELIIEVQVAYVAQTNREEPSRSTVDRAIRKQPGSYRSTGS
jgi:hypothetical protein